MPSVVFNTEMRRAERLFDIIQILRMAKRPVTAAALATELEVTARTVYRDVADLQARRVPIAGEAGVGYVLQRGFDLPPLMFTSEEIDAIALGVRLVRRTRDARLLAAADRVLAKLAAVVPDPLRIDLEAPPFFVSEGSAPAADRVDLGAVREAIRATRKLRIAYVDHVGERTERTIWPIAMAYYVDVTLIGAWCELRRDYRNFRVDRIAASELLDARFPADRGRLMAEWLALRKDRP
jgi:predicted DNA-binding transcriptional regulator YafY